jgi:processive 1,2-diacylglycerol beta-glucosyltransferase
MSILILHASVGGGHKSAARALTREFATLHGSLDPRFVDAFDGADGVFRTVYTQLALLTMAHAPGIYGAVYRATHDLDGSGTFRKFRSAVNRSQTNRLGAYLRESRPTAIVCTHFMPLEVALRERRAGHLSAPIYSVVTDYASHGLWREPDADLTFCTPGQAEADLLEGGIARERIVASGIPIDPCFAEPYDLATEKRRAGLSPRRPTVLVLGGGFAMGAMLPVLAEVAEQVCREADVVVVCGKNEKLKARAEKMLAQLELPGRVLGFVDPLVSLLRGADVVVTKPGGLTTSECLALGKPTVFYEVAPGQEALNARHVVERGAGIAADSPEEAASAALQLVRSPARRAALADRARAIGRPRAAKAIVATVLRHLKANGLLSPLAESALPQRGLELAGERRVVA